MHIQHIHQQLQHSLEQQADKETALKKQQYMKSSLPYWGLYQDELNNVIKENLLIYQPQTNDQYRTTIEYIFTHATHREEWYAALKYAIKFKKYITQDNIDLYQKIIGIGQWWDIIDTVSPHLLGQALKNSAKLEYYLLTWIDDRNMWVRRSALLTQLMYKEDMNFQLLSRLILKVAHEKEFFIKKAIGWVLRQYSKTNKNDVQIFIDTHKEKLSLLSIKEGSKYL